MPVKSTDDNVSGPKVISIASSFVSVQVFIFFLLFIGALSFKVDIEQVLVLIDHKN
jgi:hypothetical protein